MVKQFIENNLTFIEHGESSSANIPVSHFILRIMLQAGNDSVDSHESVSV